MRASFGDDDLSAIGQFVDQCYHHLYREFLDNVAPAAVFFGRQHEILWRMERIKAQVRAVPGAIEDRSAKT